MQLWYFKMELVFGIRLKFDLVLFFFKFQILIEILYWNLPMVLMGWTYLLNDSFISEILFRIVFFEFFLEIFLIHWKAIGFNGLIRRPFVFRFSSQYIICGEFPFCFEIGSSIHFQGFHLMLCSHYFFKTRILKIIIQGLIVIKISPHFLYWIVFSAI